LNFWYIGVLNPCG